MSTVYESHTAPDNNIYWLNQGDTLWFGQTFQVTTDHMLESVSLKLSRIGNPGRIIVGIRDILASGYPVENVDLLPTVSTDGNTLNENGGWRTIPMPLFHLEKGHSYTIVISAPDSATDNELGVHVDNPGGYTGGDFFIKDCMFGGCIWVIDAGTDMLFEETGASWTTSAGITCGPTSEPVAGDPADFTGFPPPRSEPRLDISGWSSIAANLITPKDGYVTSISVYLTGAHGSTLNTAYYDEIHKSYHSNVKARCALLIPRYNLDTAFGPRQVARYVMETGIQDIQVGWNTFNFPWKIRVYPQQYYIAILGEGCCVEFRTDPINDIGYTSGLTGASDTFKRTPYTDIGANPLGDLAFDKCSLWWPIAGGRGAWCMYLNYELEKSWISPVHLLFKYTKAKGI